MSYYERGEIPPIGQVRAKPPKIDEFNTPSMPKPIMLEGWAGGEAVLPDQQTMRYRGKTPHVPGLSPPQNTPSAMQQFYNEQLGEPYVDPNAVFKKEDFQKPVLRIQPRPGAIDHPLIGGKLTVFVLCFGPHAELAVTCVNSILNTLPEECLDLRVGLNAVEPATRTYFEALRKTGVAVKLYDSLDITRKYPRMRQMFHDPANPITTKYVVWFDDDAKVVDTSMWSQLCDTIVANHPQGSRLYGAPFMHDVQMFAKGDHDPMRWFRQAPWYRGRGMKVRGRGQEAPNGSIIDFAAGWFWALATETIKAAQIPDMRLNHNGGDATIGEQVHQAGFKVKAFNHRKELVWCPTKENGGRRGYSEPFPWANPGAKA